jgi:TolB protein
MQHHRTFRRAGSISLIIAALLVATHLRCEAQIHPIAFDRNDAIYVLDPETKKPRKLVDGIFPAVSPDGARIAFNTVEKNGTTYDRHIAVVNIADGKTTVFKDVPSTNSYYPVWTRDGQWIAFTLRRDQVWDLARIKPDGTGFALIRKGAENETTFYSPCWSSDGQTLFCQDMTNIYRLNLDGSVAEKWKIHDVIPNGDMSGDGRISVSPDGKRLLLSIEMGEEHHRKDWDGPPPALWSFDLASHKATRLTTKNLFAWDGCWLDNDSVLFLSSKAGEKEPSLYSMATNGSGLKKLTPDAHWPAAP